MASTRSSSSLDGGTNHSSSSSNNNNKNRKSGRPKMWKDEDFLKMGVGCTEEKKMLPGAALAQQVTDRTSATATSLGKKVGQGMRQMGQKAKKVLHPNHLKQQQQQQQQQSQETTEDSKKSNQDKNTERTKTTTTTTKNEEESKTASAADATSRGKSPAAAADAVVVMRGVLAENSKPSSGTTAATPSTIVKFPSWTVPLIWCISLMLVVRPTHTTMTASSSCPIAPPAAQHIPNQLLLAWLWIAYLTGHVVPLTGILALLEYCISTAYRHVYQQSQSQQQHSSSSGLQQQQNEQEQTLLHDSTQNDSDTEQQQKPPTARGGKLRRSGPVRQWIQQKTHNNNWTFPWEQQGQQQQQQQQPRRLLGPRRTSRGLSPYSSLSASNTANRTRRPTWLDRLDPFINKQQHQHHQQQPQHQGDGSGANQQKLVSESLIQTVLDNESQCNSSNTNMSIAPHAMGGVNTALLSADSFDDMLTISPLLKVRGMDIFLTPPGNTGNEVFDVGQHSWLIQQGLRRVPTLVMNGVTQWGNILVYFEMPSWVTNLTTALQENPDKDSDSELAFKRFLKGSDDYRNQRFKMIPSLVDGPMALKILAPPKRERVVHGAVMPISWYMHDTFEVQQPCVVCAMDCLSSRAIRSMAGIVKKYLQKSTLDLAMVIGSPQQQQQQNKNEPHACLGFFRFDQIDFEECPEFPPLHAVKPEEQDGSPEDDEEEEEDDEDDNELEYIAMAKQLSGMSERDFKQLLKDEKVEHTHQDHQEEDEDEEDVTLATPSPQ